VPESDEAHQESARPPRALVQHCRQVPRPEPRAVSTSVQVDAPTPMPPIPVSKFKFTMYQ